MKKRTVNLFAKFVLTIGALTLVSFGQNGNRTNGKAPNGNGAVATLNGLKLPLAEGSIKFIAIGDTGTGSKQQLQLAKIMLDYRNLFPYEFVIMVGDNMYGGEKPGDFENKFEDPYKPILDKGVMFYAALGNHDESNQRFYKLFNMSGEEYYRFKKGDIAFYALNSNYMDKRQIKWIEDEMGKDQSKWKIAFFHHPPYSSGGKHGSSLDLREVVEPVFVKNGVDVVFTGHEHFYERIKPQRGITYFITGAGGKLRSGDVKSNSPLTAKAYDKDLSFMLVEIVKDTMYFQVISRTGATVDFGAIARRETTNVAATTP